MKSIVYCRKFKDLNSDEKLEYSMAKLGYLNSMLSITKNLYNKISSLNYDFDAVTSVPHQHIGFLNNPAEIIGKNIAFQTQKRYLYMNRTLRKGQNQYFYYTPKERIQLNQETIGANVRTFRNLNILLIDDLSASGSVIKISHNKLTEAGAKSVYPIVDIKINPHEYQMERVLDLEIINSHRNGKKYKLKN